MRITFEGNDRSLVLAGFDYVFDEGADGRFLLRQRAFFRAAHVNQESDRQRLIGFLLKREQRLRHVVFQHADVAFLQRCEVAIVPVRDAEGQIGQVGLGANNLDVLA